MLATAEMDYHVHSAISPDSKAPMMEMCQAAVDLGLREIVFTEHFEFYSGEKTGPFLFPEYLERYFESIAQCRQHFAGRLRIMRGLELGQAYKDIAKSKQVISYGTYDYIIGSLHKLNNVDVSQLDYTPETMPAIAQHYYEELLHLVQTCDFDCLGHLDLLKRHCRKFGLPDTYDAHMDLITEVLKTLIQRGKGIEINTSGLRQESRETMPGLSCLKLYHSLGGRIVTVGSDAHRPQDVGAGLADAYSLLREAGFSRVARYENRKCGFINI